MDNGNGIIRYEGWLIVLICRIHQEFANGWRNRFWS